MQGAKDHGGLGATAEVQAAPEAARRPNPKDEDQAEMLRGAASLDLGVGSANGCPGMPFRSPSLLGALACGHKGRVAPAGACSRGCQAPPDTCGKDGGGVFHGQSWRCFISTVKKSKRTRDGTETASCLPGGSSLVFSK